MRMQRRRQGLSGQRMRIQGLPGLEGLLEDGGLMKYRSF